MNLMWFHVTYLVIDSDHICDFSSLWWFVCNSQILTSSWGKLAILFINNVLNPSIALSIILTKLVKAIQYQQAPGEKILFSATPSANTLQQNLPCDGVSIQWAVYVCHTSSLFIGLSDSSLTWSYFFYTSTASWSLTDSLSKWNASLHFKWERGHNMNTPHDNPGWLLIEILNCHQLYFKRNNSHPKRIIHSYLLCNIHGVHFKKPKNKTKASIN